MKRWMWVWMVTAVFLAACSAGANDAGMANDDMANMNMNADANHEHAADDHAHDEAQPARVPNEGAVIRLVAPTDGAEVRVGDEVVVEIETENVTVGEDGVHWHVYVDGTSWGMVMGQNLTQVLRGLEPGAHQIEVYLSIETHEELEDGDAVTITVVE